MPTGVPNPPLSLELLADLSEEGSGGCRLWTGRTFRTGYAVYKHLGKTIYPHRWVYEQMYGPIPEGWTVDHQCHDPEVCQLKSDCPHRRCVEPTHLKAMTAAENSMRGGGPLAHKARQTACVRGHSLSGTNLYVTPDGRRQCRRCRSDWSNEYQKMQRRKTKEN